MAKISKKEKIKSTNNPLLSKIKLKSPDEVSEFAENIINTVRETLLVLDKDLRVLKASRSFYDFFKVTSDETIGRLIYDLGNHQWNIPKLRELLETILPEKTTFDNYEVEHDFSTIGKRIMLLNARQIKRALGKEKIILLAIEDITERKIAEKSVSETSRVTDEYLDILFNHAHEPIIIWDASFVITHINHAFEKLSGYDWTEVRDKKIDILFPKDKIDSTLELIKNTLLNDERPELIEIDILTKDKDLKTVLWNPANIFDKEGKHIVATIAQDITNRKRTEEALSILETRYRRLFESTKDGILILDAETGKIIDVNPFFIELLGYSKEQLIEKEIWKIGFFKDIAANYDKFLELQQKGYVRYENLPLETADGRKINAEFVSNVYLVNHRKVVHCYIRDITERKQTEEEIRNLAKFPSENPGPILRIAQNGTLLYVNEAGLKQLPEWKLQTEQSAPNMLQDVVFNALDNGAVQVVEFEHREKVYLFYVAPIVVAGYANLYGRDITERKLTEEALRESEERFRTAAENLMDVVYDWDIKEKIDWYGDIDGIMGYPSGGFPRTLEGWAVTIHPEDKDRVLAALEGHLKGVVPYVVEYRVRRRDGEWRWWSARGTALRDNRGKPYKMIGSITDITERKQAEEAVQRSELRFRTLYENAKIGLYRTTPDGTILMANKALVKMLGYPSFEKIVERNLEKDGYEPTYQRKEFLEKIEKDGEVNDFESAWVRLDGSVFFGRESAQAIRDSQGTTLYYDGMVEDITERKRMEKVIQESEERFRMVFENVLDGISIYNEDPDPSKRRLIECNERYATMAGRSRDELLQLGSTRGLQIMFEDKSESNRLESLDRGTSFRGSFSWIRPDGKENIIEYVGTPITWRGKSYTIGIDRDITERKLAEEALHEREQLFRGLFNASPDAIVLIDPHNSTISWPIVDCNEATCQMSGYTREELIGQSIDVLNITMGTPEERIAYFINLRQKEITHVETTHRHKDGHIFPVEVSTSIVTIGEHEMVLGIDRDITERKRAEADLQASNETKRIFAERLAILSETTTELSKAETLDELCRRAVELGRERLDFDRSSIWLATKDSTTIQGTFGVDVDGRIVDERSESITVGSGYDFWPVIQGQVPLLRLTDAQLALKGQNVGQGMHVYAGLFDGNTVIGYLTVDNLLRQRPISDSDCEIIRLYASAVGHLCSLKRTEENLRDERSQFRTLIDNIPDSIYSKDTQGLKTVANLEEVRNLGAKSEAEVLGKDDFAFYPKDLAEGFKVDDQLVLNTGTPVINREEFVFDNRGKKRWILTSKLPLKDTNNKIIGLVGMGRDITESKHLVEVLTFERNLLKSLMDNTPDHIYFKDLENRFIRISKAHADIFGISDPAQAIGKTDFDFFMEEHARPAYETELEIMKTGRSIVDLEEKETWPDGTATWVSTTKVPLRDINGEIIGTFGISRDITKRKRAEELQAKERNLLQTLIDNLPDYIYVKDIKGRFELGNTAVVHQMGLKTQDELVGKTDFDFFPRDLAEQYYADEQKIIQSGKGLYNFEGPTQDMGKQKWVSTTKVLLRDAQGNIVGFVGLGHDMTERKRAEEEITMLAHSLRSINECVSITDLKDKILFVNESYLKTYGYDKNELIGKHISIVRSQNNPPELVKEILPSTLEGGWQGELWNKRKDGSEFLIHLSTTVINDKDGKAFGLIGVAKDITELKHSERELIEAKEKAEQSDKLKSEFLAQMSHEIRTPLNAIVGNVDYLNELFGKKIDSDARDCFDGIDLASKRIIRTVDLILNAAELQTSGYKPQFVTVDLNSGVLEELYLEHQLSAKQKGLEIIYTCKEKDTKVIADEYSITQIFANLIDNAIKYTKEGKVEILLGKNKTGNMMAEVKDTGIGISKEFLPRIFEPFIQEDQGFTRSFEGNGLGLVLVKGYCELNNAIIEVESEKNVGSTFRIIFNKKVTEAYK